MQQNLPTKVWENGLNVATANELLQLTEGLTLTKILAEENEPDKLQERYELLKLMYRDAKKTMARCEKEGKELKAKLEALPPKATLQNTDGAFMKVGKFIAEVVKQLNVHQTMNEKQIDFAATDILDQYGDKITLKELAWIFRKGIMGNYSKTDFKLDVQTLHAWIQKHLSDKNERISQHNNQLVLEAEAMSERKEVIKRLSNHSTR
jgi:hypothetical protein